MLPFEFLAMDDGVEGEPQTLKTAGGRVSQVLLTVKTSATAYGSLNNSVNGSDISSITSVDELDQGECLEGGRCSFLVI